MNAPWTLVLAFDRNYVVPAAVCLRSIDAHLENPPSGVYVVAEGITLEDADLIERQFSVAPVKVISAVSPLANFGNNSDTAHATPAQFLKCMAPRILDKADNRLLYIDVDTLVLGDLGELACTDIGTNIAGFVPDRFVTNNVLDPGEHPYYNSGVFVADKDKWNTRRITEDIVATITERAEILEYGDQDALNYCLRGAIFPLEGRWNYMLSEREKTDPDKRISERVDEVTVLHFCGPVKPWKTEYAHPYLRELYSKYLAAVHS